MKKTRPRLKQLPMFHSPELLAAVEDLGPDARARAEDMQRRAVAPKDDTTWCELLFRVATENGITLGLALSTSRPRAIVRTRQRVWWELRTRGEVRFEVLADVFGVHHTTIIHGVQAHQARLDDERAAQAAVERYQAEVDAAAGGRAA